MLVDGACRGLVPGGEMAYSDSALIQGLREKDKNAFEAMYEQFFPKVVNHAFHVLKDQEMAENVTESIFLDLIDSIDELPRNTTLTKWVYQLTRQHLAKFTPAQRKISIRFQGRVGVACAGYRAVKEAVSNAYAQK